MMPQPQDIQRPTVDTCDVPEVAVGSHQGPVSNSRVSLVLVCIIVLSAAYSLNILILFDVIVNIIYKEDYGRDNLLRVWDGLLIGQIIGQIVFGFLCDLIGHKRSLLASSGMILVGSILCTAARGISGFTTGFLWMLTVARGIIGVGIGGVYPAASMITFEETMEGTSNDARTFILVTNGAFSAGAPLAAIIFLIVLSAAQPGHLATVWPICIGIGVVIPVISIVFNSLWLVTRSFGSRIFRHVPAYWVELKRNWLTMVRISALWFVYGFVAYPKIVFSGLILYRVVDGSLWRTAGLELLLGGGIMGGSLVGAVLYRHVGWHKILVASFIGYDVFALIIGCAYDHLVKIVPLFAIFYAIMLAMGSLGPGNLLSLITADSFPRPVRGAYYGITAAFGSAGAVAGIHAFNAIDETLRKQWGFIITALCGIVGTTIAWSLPANTPTAQKLESCRDDPCEIQPEDVVACVSTHSVDNKDLTSSDDSGVDSPQAAGLLKSTETSLPSTPGLSPTSISPTSLRGLVSMMPSPMTPPSTSAAPAIIHVSRPGSPTVPGAYQSLRSLSDQRGKAIAATSVAVADAHCGLRPGLSGQTPASRTHRANQDDHGPSIGIPSASYARDTRGTLGLHIPAPSSSHPGRSTPMVPSRVTEETVVQANLRPIPEAHSHVLLLHRMSAAEYEQVEMMAPTFRQIDEAAADYVASNSLGDNFADNPDFVHAVVERAAKLPINDPNSFPVTRENVTRITCLSMYQPIIYCDDSRSMFGTQWDVQRKLVDRIAKLATRVVPDSYGVWLRFINSYVSGNNLTYTDVLQCYNSVGPTAATPLGTRLRERILKPLVYDVMSSRPNGRLERPLLVCVITDGMPTENPSTAFEDAIVECKRFLIRAGSPPTQVRFCVNQIGGDVSAANFLDSLRRNQEIQDVVCCTTGRLDTRFSELQQNERELETWLLTTLTDPIIPADNRVA